mgnify:CR=1 FL=1
MVKPGYKQTEIGVIPEDWEIKYLSDFGKISRRKLLAHMQTPCDIKAENLLQKRTNISYLKTANKEHAIPEARIWHRLSIMLSGGVCGRIYSG